MQAARHVVAAINIAQLKPSQRLSVCLSARRKEDCECLLDGFCFHLVFAFCRASSEYIYHGFPFSEVSLPHVTLFSFYDHLLRFINVQYVHTSTHSCTWACSSFHLSWLMLLRRDLVRSVSNLGASKEAANRMSARQEKRY